MTLPTNESFGRVFRYLAGREGQIVTDAEIAGASGGEWSLGTVHNYHSKKLKNLLVRVNPRQTPARYQVTGIGLMTEPEFVGVMTQVTQAILDERSRIVREALAEGESGRVEFKASVPANAAGLASEIASFASSGGGVILIGVTDAGAVVGTTETRERAESIVNVVQPRPVADVSLVPHNGKVILLIRVHGGPEPLYFANDRPYIRVGTSARPATAGDVTDAVLRKYQPRRELTQFSVELDQDEAIHHLVVPPVELSTVEWGISPPDGIAAKWHGDNCLDLSRSTAIERQVVEVWIRR